LPPRVDFYVSAEAGDGARLRLVCRVVEKAYLAKQRVVCYSDDPTLLPRLDEMLWTFGDGSFVPHDLFGGGNAPDAPVVLTTGPMPPGEPEVLVNLAQAVPPFFAKFARVAEFLDARPEIRGAGRERFKAYRAQAIEPQTHNVS